MSADIGRPLYFDLAAHIACVESLIRSDEIDLALKVCDMVPSYYRMPQRYPRELAMIKQTIARQLYDQIEYANDDEEAACTREFGEAQWTNGYMYPRAEIIERIIFEYNANGCTPWIFDLGCSHGNLPLGLIQAEREFTYKGVGLNSRIVDKVRKWAVDHWADEPPRVLSESDELEPVSAILYCSEVLEHASRLEDIVTTALKECVDWDVIVLSVPLNTLGGGLPDYANRRLGHVRCFNELELFEFANKHWPGYRWELTLADSQVIVGRR